MNFTLKLIVQDRPMWTNRLEFILASMAAIWGIGNMGSFIYAMQEFGGGKIKLLLQLSIF